MTEADHVFVRGLRGRTVVGVHEWEQRDLRDVVVDLELAVDVRRAAASDSLDDTVSYSGVSARVLAFLLSSRTRLIETLAERLAHLLLTEFPVSRVAVEIEKPGAVDDAHAVGVRIERGREPAGTT